MDWWNGDGHMGWMAMWWVLGTLLIAVLMVAVLKATRGATSGPSESPQEILERRYAKGEIDRETYQQMRTDLRLKSG